MGTTQPLHASFIMGPQQWVSKPVVAVIKLIESIRQVLHRFLPFNDISHNLCHKFKQFTGMRINNNFWRRKSCLHREQNCSTHQHVLVIHQVVEYHLITINHTICYSWGKMKSWHEIKKDWVIIAPLYFKLTLHVLITLTKASNNLYSQ